MRRSPSLIALFVLLAAATVCIFLSGQSLPPVVASHFASGGDANGFMPRSAYIGLMLFLTMFVPLLLALVHDSMRFVPPRFFSLPNREYWLAPERAAETFAFFDHHGRYFSALLAIFLCFVHWLVVRANELQPPQLSPTLFFTGLLLFLVAVAFWIGVLVAHFRRAP